MKKSVLTTEVGNIMRGLDTKNVLSSFSVINTSVSVNKVFTETQIPDAFITNANAAGYSFTEFDDAPERIIKTFVAAVSSFLGANKISNEQEAAALILQDTSGVFKFAGIVEYHENSTDDEPGNWSYVMTFNEDDVTELDKSKKVNKFLFGDTAFKSVFSNVARDIASIEFSHDTYIYDACNLVVDTFIQILDKEANVSEQVDIEIPGYATLSVSVEGDEKIFAITPDGAMKELIKGDLELDK